jgi:hypothetical protein
MRGLTKSFAFVVFVLFLTLMLLPIVYSQIPNRYVSSTGRMSTSYTLNVFSPNEQLTYNNSLPLNFTLEWTYDIIPLSGFGLSAEYAYSIDNSSLVNIAPNNASLNDRFASNTTFVWNPSFFYLVDISNLPSGLHNVTVRASFYFGKVLFLNDTPRPFAFTVYSTLTPIPTNNPLNPTLTPTKTPISSQPTSTPSLTSTVTSTPSSWERLVSFCSVHPAPNATDVPLDTTIVVDELRPIDVGLSLQPYVALSEKVENYSVASRYAIFSPNEVLKPTTIYTVTAHIAGEYVTWTFTTASELSSKPAVPEFPAWIILPLAMITVLSAVLVSRKRNGIRLSQST